ncbi:hypothetical protein, partial [Salmonella enterica]|uniref:hypothetical protein n=1 Tax=Salmonella enterica TaxID=28901 RepID=UPI00329718DA
ITFELSISLPDGAHATDLIGAVSALKQSRGLVSLIFGEPLAEIFLKASIPSWHPASKYSGGGEVDHSTVKGMLC